MEVIPKQLPALPLEDFRLAVVVRPERACGRSNVLLARAHYDGTLELLSAAWERLLGYGRREIAGKTLGQLMGSGKAVAVGAVAAILDELNPAPVDLKLSCSAGEVKCLTLHRRFDSHARTVYIVAEESRRA